MIRLVFLVEEPSMRAFLLALLPRFSLPAEPQIIVFPDKNGLDKGAPDRMRSWHDAPGIEPRFIVVRDNDGADCRAIKARIHHLCRESRYPLLVRLVMQELESWFYGDLAAVAAAYGRPEAIEVGGKRGYRIPDAIPKPSVSLSQVLDERAKVDRAERIAPHMDLERNTSVSFRVFCEGVRKLAEIG